MTTIEILIRIFTNPFFWFCITLSIIYFYSFSKLHKKFIKNENVLKVEVSEKRTFMVWISEKEFFIDVKVDRNKSWREVLHKMDLSYEDNSSERFILDSMPKLDESLPRKVRLYFKKSPTSFEVENFKSDPMAMLHALAIDDDLLKKYNATSIWFRNNKYNRIEICNHSQVLYMDTTLYSDTKSVHNYFWLVYTK